MKDKQQTVRLAEPEIHDSRDLLVRLESSPASAAAIAGMDKWHRWQMDHGMPLDITDFDSWETGSLRCLVLYTPPNGRVPQAWLFNGGPDNDPRLRLECLPENARKQRLTRFISKVLKLGRQLGLTFKVERASDCSKTIYTATTSAYAFTMPQPRNSR
jgi:hypothetical protein